MCHSHILLSSKTLNGNCSAESSKLQSVILSSLDEEDSFVLLLLLDISATIYQITNNNIKRTLWDKQELSFGVLFSGRFCIVCIPNIYVSDILTRLDYILSNNIVTIRHCVQIHKRNADTFTKKERSGCGTI